MSTSKMNSWANIMFLLCLVLVHLTQGAPSNNCSSVLAAVEGLGVPAAKGEFIDNFAKGPQHQLVVNRNR